MAATGYAQAHTWIIEPVVKDAFKFCIGGEDKEGRLGNLTMRIFTSTSLQHVSTTYFAKNFELTINQNALFLYEICIRYKKLTA